MREKSCHWFIASLSVLYIKPAFQIENSYLQRRTYPFSKSLDMCGGFSIWGLQENPLNNSCHRQFHHYWFYWAIGPNDRKLIPKSVLAAEPFCALSPIQNWQSYRLSHKWVKAAYPVVLYIAFKIQKSPKHCDPLFVKTGASYRRFASHFRSDSLSRLLLLDPYKPQCGKLWISAKFLSHNLECLCLTEVSKEHDISCSWYLFI